MKRVLIKGGPAPVDIRIILEPEGIDITEHVLGIEIQPSGETLMRAKLTVFAETNLVVEVTEVKTIKE